MAQPGQKRLVDRAYRWLDSFHNVEPERAPSKIGCALTLLLMPVVLVYVVVWVIQHEAQPPVESMVIDWSILRGPFPMKVQCEQASCWMWISGCTSGTSDQCVALSSGEERTLEMCYAIGARHGMHMWWSSPNSTDPAAAGVKIVSEALNAETSQLVEPGRSSMTYVRTHDTTEQEGSYKHLRNEWFVSYLSSEALEPSHQGCRNLVTANANMAQVVMRPEFYDKKIEKMDLWVSVIGEAGGAFGLFQTGFFALYLLLWYLQDAQKPKDGVATTGVSDMHRKATDAFSQDVERAII
ncbi:unnamed protein product [Symbiodinium microadriaticum]|nr:unnamed protein product [Symbiodinium microadriaticum]CAE7614552.1 unnamed protein product [Symbiodinium sp. KB8]